MTKVLIVASEGMPFVKTGGLADVVGALPKSLLAVAVDVAVMMPKHSKIKAEHEAELKTIYASTIMLGWREKYLGIQTLVKNGVTYYFIDNEDYFGGPVYLGGDAENEQYLYFCKAVCEALPHIGFDPDVLHLNDWHTGMIPFLLKEQYGHRYEKPKKTLFTIHNIKFQGQMSFEFMSDILSIPPRYYIPTLLEADGCANMMKAGLVYADKISTVSPNYANEIMNRYFGMGMEGILSARRQDVSGILNGIDTVEFNPEKDSAIAENYSANDIRGKLSCKKALISEFNLDIKTTTPIISMVTRLTSQKGLDLVQYVLEELLHEDVAFVMLGSGDEVYQDFFNYIAAKYPANTGVYIGYDEDLAHRIYSGADFLLMPSEFEPCGLSQMIAQRYGNLPIVRETGGLVDTVSPYNRYTQEGDGFAFSTFNGHDMLASIRLALSVYRDKPVLRRLKRNAMLNDNSFTKSAKEYKELYDRINHE
ncbi:MAG: glycogen synthase GlgA [Clostridiales Family XIII bacterium]|jgi:starch synthase|nr:glycogen synthase GlgA [Clostridiales Family XIII bacterium]